MARMTYLRSGQWCLGACIAFLVTLGLLWAPTHVLAAPGGQDCPTLHKIALGENLTLIAAKYEVTVAALAEENGLEDANLIVEGQALCIPAQHGPGIENWGSYGVPGQSYDPSLMKKQESNGPQDAGSGAQEYRDSNPIPMVPGKSYDPSLYGKQENWQPQNAYDVPGKAEEPKEPKAKPEHYWKDDGYFPTYTPRIDEIDPVEPTPTPEPMVQDDVVNGEEG